MATRTSRNSTRSNTSRTSHGVDSAQSQQQAAYQTSQQRMVVAADTTSAMLRGAETWTRLQLNALERTGQTWRETAEKMRAANGPLELMAAQNHLLMNSMVQAMQFGQEFLQATLAIQPDLARVREESAPPTATEPLSPMMQAWQTMLNPVGLNGAATTGQH